MNPRSFPSINSPRQQTGAFFYVSVERPLPVFDAYVRMAFRKICVSSSPGTYLPGSFSSSRPEWPGQHYCHKHQSSRNLTPPFMGQRCPFGLLPQFHILTTRWNHCTVPHSNRTAVLIARNVLAVRVNAFISLPLPPESPGRADHRLATIR